MNYRLVRVSSYLLGIHLIHSLVKVVDCRHGNDRESGRGEGISDNLCHVYDVMHIGEKSSYKWEMSGLHQ